jgi:Zn finger protein HypA/HybF involved in hydrogenase expression
MHEIGLLSAAVAALCDAAEGPITQVTLALGPGVDHDAAVVAWRTTSEATPAADARVTWQRGHDHLACLSCGAVYEGDPLTQCPGCHGDGLAIEPAPEIAIVEYRIGFHGAPISGPDRPAVPETG